jgi:hypothetical protein
MAFGCPASLGKVCGSQCPPWRGRFAPTGSARPIRRRILSPLSPPGETASPGVRCCPIGFRGQDSETPKLGVGVTGRSGMPLLTSALQFPRPCPKCSPGRSP